MSADVAVLVATAVLAVVAVTAALVAVLAARRVARGAVAPAAPAAPVAAASHLLGDLPGAPEVVDTELLTVDLGPVRPAALEPRVVEGRVVVPPTQDQVVAAALGRPQARISVVAQGVAHALRPESRDRIGALVRREYRARRRARLRAGRRAARAANASPTPTAAADQWLGET
jgi:hypothetical protein